MFLATRVILSIPWPEGNDGRYYWEHCGWIDTDDFSFEPQMMLFILSNTKLLYTSQVQIHSTRTYLPGTQIVHNEVIYTPDQFGSQLPRENFNILVCARWRMRGEDGSYTYHLHRQPTGEEELIDGIWTDEGYLAQQTRCNTYVFQNRWRTSTGSLIDTGVVAQLPVMWQLRHGTKRRRRRFWLPD